MITKQNLEWVQDTLKKVEFKLSNTVIEVKTLFPYTTQNGKYEKTVNQLPMDDICWWTNGFWSGIMWLMYLQTNNENYKQIAIDCEIGLDEALDDYYRLHHDVGFMWLTSSVANYRITKDEKAKKRGFIAANILAGRYNPNGKFIRAWNGEENIGVAIIDCMMNIPILYWATEITGDPRFRDIAINHADTAMRTFVRPDGSCNHIVRFDSETGEVLETPGGQGYAAGSAWSRGQAWALYGFILSYIHTNKIEYLDTAKKVAHYFIANVCDEYVAKCDFRSPTEPVIYDSTAGVIAACGLIEIAKNVPEFEKNFYMNNAIKILKSTEEKFCNWEDNEQSILQMGTGSYHNMIHIPIIYGDYYFIEALLKIKGNNVLFW